MHNWVGFTKLRVIGHMYKICLLTMTAFYAILKLDLAGAAPPDQQPAIKAGWAGKPENGQQPSRSPCATVWLPVIAALKDLKCEPAEASLWQKPPSVCALEVCLVAAKGREHLETSRWQSVLVV